jgi:hypothetical protein
LYSSTILQEDRQGDHRAAEGDLLEHLLRDPEPEQLRCEQVRVEQRRPALALASHEPVDEPRQPSGADRQ